MLQPNTPTPADARLQFILCCVWVSLLANKRYIVTFGTTMTELSSSNPWTSVIHEVGEFRCVFLLKHEWLFNPTRVRLDSANCFPSHINDWSSLPDTFNHTAHADQSLRRSDSDRNLRIHVFWWANAPEMSCFTQNEPVWGIVALCLCGFQLACRCNTDWWRLRSKHGVNLWWSFYG